MPYEHKIGELKAIDQARRGKELADQKLLNEFYLPLFESGLIGEMHFLPDWITSAGATWERLQAERLGIAVFDIHVQQASRWLVGV